MAFFTDKLCRLFSTPESLHKKRRSGQVKTLETAIADSLASGLQQQQSSSSSCCKSSIDSTTDGMDLLVKDILNKERPSPLIVGVAKSKLGDPNNNNNDDEDDVDDRKEIYLHLAIPSAASTHNDTDTTTTDDDISIDRIVLVPVSSFAEKLAEAFEQQLTSIAMCFVADASSGIGTQVIGEIVTTCNAGLVLIKEPSWMTSLATLTEQNLISKPKIDRILFALCRLDAWRVRTQIGTSRTVVFTLPGQSSTAPLLPHLQRIFPCERHVFVYDGCVDSTARAVRLTNTTGTTSSSSSNNTTRMSPSLPRSITSTTPISPLTSIRDYPTHLYELSTIPAAAVEAWMSSVDAFLTLKENERESGYLPFVCRLGYLFADTGRLGNGAVDQSELALANVLQYVTGSRSRALDGTVLDAAKVALRNCRSAEGKEMQKYGQIMTGGERVAIEACVFAHKGILIGDKTLLDTVQPKKEWSLKAAKKMTSCSCCAPEDESDEDEEGSNGGGGGGSNDGEGSSRGGDGVIPNMVKSPYVDGKNAFAFDPSKFTGM